MSDDAVRDPSSKRRTRVVERLAAWFRAGGWKAALGAAVGSVALAAYSYLVGCRTGSCVLTSRVDTASLLGALLGLVVAWPARVKEEDADVKR